MLVLSRKIGEVIVIDGNIRIQITEIGNGRVKIGVDAPRDVHIAREELLATPARDENLHQLLKARGRILEATKSTH
ncbi:hypothetical protein BH11PLA2_BH11PLA2_37740 [soil metagenome]